MTVTIKSAVLRDASYITANLREQDVAETFCQLAPGVTPIELAWWVVMMPSSEMFIAYLDDEPVTLFGTSPITPYCYALSAIGTDKFRRTVPEVSRFLMTVHVEKRITQDGCLTMEARSIDTHVEAHRWMLSMGAEQLGGPFPYGAAGERFLMFRWTVAGYRAIREKRWSE